MCGFPHSTFWLKSLILKELVQDFLRANPKKRTCCVYTPISAFFIILGKGLNLRVCLCCGVSKSTTADDYYKIDRYINKQVLKTKTDLGLKVAKETVFIAMCDNCDSLIVEIHRHAINKFGKKKLAEKEVLRGAKALEYYNATAKNRIYTPLESPFEKPIKSAKTIPFIYGKVLDRTTQQPYYLDDSGNAGNIIKQKIYTHSR